MLLLIVIYLWYCWYYVLPLLLVILAIKYIEYRLSLMITIGLYSLMVDVDLFVDLGGIT